MRRSLLAVSAVVLMSVLVYALIGPGLLFLASGLSGFSNFTVQHWLFVVLRMGLFFGAGYAVSRLGAKPVVAAAVTGLALIVILSFADQEIGMWWVSNDSFRMVAPTMEGLLVIGLELVSAMLGDWVTRQGMCQVDTR